jgi:hypothetical protein
MVGINIVVDEGTADSYNVHVLLLSRGMIII